jgi:hypothetical protein
VLLNLNPGFSPDDRIHHGDPVFINRSRGNLLHHSSNFPFFLLDPAITAPGNKWWTRKLGAVIQRFGLGAIANRVLCIEYFPYHSRRFGHRRLNLPSQTYSFLLVHMAIAQRATIILMRSEALWFAAVPELSNYDRVYRLNSPQSPYISARNCRDQFETICEALCER